MRNQAMIVMVIGGLLLPGVAAAQVAWDAPYLMPPHAPAGLGIYLVETAGGELGAMTTWRGVHRPHNLGWRLGVAEAPRDDLTVYGGLDVSGPWHRATARLPLDVGWIGGAGIAIGHHALLSLPLGVTAGRTVVGEGGFRVTPYFSPRVIVDATIGRRTNDDGDADGVDLDLTLDLGIDVRFPGNWLARLGATVGDRDGLALGVVF